MRRLRFKASTPALFPGGRRSFSDATSNFPFAKGEGTESRRISNIGTRQKMHASTALAERSLTFQKQGLLGEKNLKYLQMSSFVGDEDDFSELGPPVSAGVDVFLELVAENHNVSLDKEHSKNLSKSALGQKGRVVQGPYCGGTNTSGKQDKHHSGFQFRVGDHNGVFESKQVYKVQSSKTEDNGNHGNLNTISVEQVPPSISLVDLKEAMSVYGEILSASMEATQDKLKDCHINFKSTESKLRAMAARRITVKNCQLHIQSFHVPEYITIRINNISIETAEPTIHSRCMSCGFVTGLSKFKEGVVDVVFHINDKSFVQSLLKQLNDVSVNGHQWSAQLLPKESANSQSYAESHISYLMRSFRKKLQMQKMYLEDLLRTCTMV